MHIRKIRKALRSDSPASQLYELIPKGQRKAFEAFAKTLGVSEEQIDDVYKRKEPSKTLR